MTMGEPLPVYPAAMSTLAQTTTGPARWHATRVAAALLAFCAVVLVIVSSFLPLYSGTLSIGTQDIEVTITPWSADIEGPSEPGDVPRVGYPLVFAAIVLACAAALNWYAATPAAGQGVTRVAGTTTAIGGAFLIGTVWTTVLMVVNGVDSVLLLGTLTPGLETEATYLVGHWLLMVGALLSLCAAVLALLPVRQPTWAQVNPDVATPPYGIALARIPAHPQQPEPGVLQVDPLTGHPMPPSPPSGVPAAPPHAFAPPQHRQPPPMAPSTPAPPTPAPPTPTPPTPAPSTPAPTAASPAAAPSAAAPPTPAPSTPAPTAASPAAAPPAAAPPAAAPSTPAPSTPAPSTAAPTAAPTAASPAAAPSAAAPSTAAPPAPAPPAAVVPPPAPGAPTTAELSAAPSTSAASPGAAEPPAAEQPASAAPAEPPAAVAPTAGPVPESPPEPAAEHRDNER
ncbi:hypothetical protein [Actinophytocola sp. KF-1]